MSENSFFKSVFSIDNVIFGFDDSDLKVLLVKRGEEPFKDHWALPGDLVHPTENLQDAAERVLRELTGISDVYLEQVHTFGDVNRHPLGRVITIAYYSLVTVANFQVVPSSWAETAQWHSVSQVSGLGFDHDEILQACISRLQQQVRIRPVGFELLPRRFTLTELQHLYEAVLDTELDKRNFRKKILSMNLLIDLNETQEGVAHRPAKLYEFDQKKYEQFKSEGFNFELKESRKKMAY